jgi:hypothetical protein
MAAAALYDLLLGRWLWMLFRHGPLRMGFWKGLADPDICARIAGNSEVRDWMTAGGGTSAACEAMIQREFNSFAVLAHTALYATTCAVVVTSLVAGARQAWAAHVQVKAFASALALTYPTIQGHQPRLEQGCPAPDGRPAKSVRPEASPSSPVPATP